MSEIKLPEPAGYLYSGGYLNSCHSTFREFQERLLFGEGRYPLYSEDQMIAAIRDKDDFHEGYAEDIRDHMGSLVSQLERAEAQRDALAHIIQSAWEAEQEGQDVTVFGWLQDGLDLIIEQEKGK